jgi:hypothetical protein
VDLEGEIDPNTMMVNWGIDYRLVLPSIGWSVPATEKDREITNTCSLDSILALFYIRSNPQRRFREDASGILK